MPVYVFDICVDQILAGLIVQLAWVRIGNLLVNEYTNVDNIGGSVKEMV